MNRRLLAALILLSACASEGTPFRWVKAGANEAELERARAQCILEANRAGVEKTRDRYEAVVRSNVFIRCMDAAGWKQEAVAD